MKQILNDILNASIVLAVLALTLTIGFWAGYDQATKKFQDDAVRLNYGMWFYTVDGSEKVFGWNPTYDPNKFKK